ncbi:MAG: hypothetical protein ACKOXM_02980 [Agromyces sp.]
MAPHTPFEFEPDWSRDLGDLPPASVMRTVSRSKPAVHAVWLARAIDLELARGYAERWHAAGWTAHAWRELAGCLALLEAREPLPNSAEEPWRREVNTAIEPEAWIGWPELAHEIGALRATIALRDNRELPLDTRVFWATHEVKVTEPGIGRPGPKRGSAAHGD